MSTAKRKLPLLDADSGFFWTAGASGQLRILRCDDCGHWQHPPLPCCPSCRGESLSPQAVGGNGRVASFTINHEAWSPGMAVPFVFAAIELDEQPELYVFSNVDATIETMFIGMRVSVYFEQHDDVFLPLFRPTNDSRLGGTHD